MKSEVIGQIRRSRRAQHRPIYDEHTPAYYRSRDFDSGLPYRLVQTAPPQLLDANSIRLARNAQLVSGDLALERERMLCKERLRHADCTTDVPGAIIHGVTERGEFGNREAEMGRSLRYVVRVTLP